MMMENRKNLEVNAGVCDIRAVTEEALTAYGKVNIACGLLLSNPEARALMSRYEVQIDAGQTMELKGDVKLSVANGRLKLTPGQTPPAEGTVLLVNGSLDIAPGCEELLKSYVSMMINGSVTIPESMAGLLTGFSINGTVRTYPDDAVRLKSTVVLDRTFALRARQDALYYAADRIIALNHDIDFGRLAEKNVRFTTRKLIVAEGLVEAAAALFDEKADIQVVPDGCAYLDDDAELNEALVRRHGGKLYIDGDLTVLEDGPWLDQVSYARVDGDVLVTKALERRLDAIDLSCEDLYVVGGTVLSGRSNIDLTAGMLERAEQGLSLVGCANVTVGEDVSVQLLRDKLLSVIACANVTCTGEQQAVIELAARDSVNIGPARGETPDGEKADTVEINAGLYTL